VAECEVIPVEAANTEEYATSPSDGGTARRRETDLTSRYRAWLEVQLHDVKRLRVRPPGELRPLFTDLYDVTAQELYEAKGTAKRNDIRMAVGQLMDYRRHIDVVVQQLTILLPERPSDDLASYIASCGMSCVYAIGRDAFDRAAS
jgi:hypothetical protein